MNHPIQPMPELDPEQYDALVADIVANGVLVPVVKDQHGRILDGNNRAKIAEQLGIDYPVKIVEVADDLDAWDKAVGLNCARRHLNREQKRELITAELMRRPDQSDRERRMNFPQLRKVSRRGRADEAEPEQLEAGR